MRSVTLLKEIVFSVLCISLQGFLFLLDVQRISYFFIEDTWVLPQVSRYQRSFNDKNEVDQDKIKDKWEECYFKKKLEEIVYFLYSVLRTLSQVFILYSY